MKLSQLTELFTMEKQSIDTDNILRSLEYQKEIVNVVVYRIGGKSTMIKPYSKKETFIIFSEQELNESLKDLNYDRVDLKSDNFKTAIALITLTEPKIEEVKPEPVKKKGK